MACPPSPCCINAALLAHRRWTDPFFSHYLWISTHAVIYTHPLRIIVIYQISKNDALLKSFKEKWVICFRRMYGMKINLAYALKCHSLTHIIYKYWKNGRGLVWKTILLVCSFLLKFLCFQISGFAFFISHFSLHLWYVLIFCCRFVAVPSLCLISTSRFDFWWRLHHLF